MITCNNCKGLVTWQLQKGHYYGTCQRASDFCKGRKLLREDALETEIARMLKELVSPSPKVIDWVADAMQARHKDTIISDKRLAESVTAQIQRIERMDSNLYDDKLAGEISDEKYEQKHADLESEKATLEQQLVNIDTNAGLRLEKRLTLLELSQKAAELYSKKTPEQKRTIITKLFEKLTYSEGIVSVTYTSFSRAIAQNVQLTHQIIGGAK